MIHSIFQSIYLQHSLHLFEFVYGVLVVCCWWGVWGELSVGVTDENLEILVVISGTNF